MGGQSQKKYGRPLGRNGKCLCLGAAVGWQAAWSILTEPGPHGRLVSRGEPAGCWPSLTALAGGLVAERRAWGRAVPG